MSMKVGKYRLTFLTPAFLGDAEQNGRWRTPPFKAQLRQWWRVAYAADHNFDVNVSRMREEEGLLFGNAWLAGKFCKSLVRLRLERWDEGKLKKAQWPSDSNVTHPNVTNPVGSALYLGYGPLTFSGGTKLKVNAAIQSGETARLAIAWPDTSPEETRHVLEEKKAADIDRQNIDGRLLEALWLMDRYGTLGGRSRNGWGSCALVPEEGSPALSGSVPLRPWRDCLNLDWPHAIGQDEKGPLIWQTETHDDWKALMKTLAVVKIGLRTQFAFTTGKKATQTEYRHWLSYPVTNHSVAAWGNLRLPNQLRFKVRKTDDGKLVGVIFHMPHLPPPAFGPDRAAIQQVWQQVHRFLDDPKRALKRISL